MPMNKSSDVTEVGSPADLAGYTSRTIEVDGVRTRYYDLGHGMPVLLVHGAGWRGESSANTFVPVFPYLSEHYRVIAPDKLGSGLTGNPLTDDGWSVEGQVAHMKALIDALGIEEFYCIGQSRGAYLAGRLALENAHRVKALVLVDSATLGPEMGDFEARRKALFNGKGMDSVDANDPIALRAALQLQHKKLSVSSDHVDQEFLDAKVFMEMTDKSRAAVEHMNSGGGNETFLGSLAKQKPDTLTRIQAGELNMPVLVYWGKDDPSAIMDIGLALFDRVSANNARSRMLIANEAGHFHYREHPEEFSFNVSQFFEFWGRS